MTCYPSGTCDDQGRNCACWQLQNCPQMGVTGSVGFDNETADRKGSTSRFAANTRVCHDIDFDSRKPQQAVAACCIGHQTKRADFSRWNSRGKTLTLPFCNRFSLQVSVSSNRLCRLDLPKRNKFPLPIRHGCLVTENVKVAVVRPELEELMFGAVPLIQHFLDKIFRGRSVESGAVSRRLCDRRNTERAASWSTLAHWPLG